MKKRTKVIAFTLSMALMATCIAGCDSSTDTKKDIVTSDNTDAGTKNTDNAIDSSTDKQSQSTPTIN